MVTAHQKKFGDCHKSSTQAMVKAITENPNVNPWKVFGHAQKKCFKKR